MHERHLNDTTLNDYDDNRSRSGPRANASLSIAARGVATWTCQIQKIRLVIKTSGQVDLL